MMTDFNVKKALQVFQQSCFPRFGQHGCLPFTTTFRKFRLESKWYMTFRVVPAENFREQRDV